MIVLLIVDKIIFEFVFLTEAPEVDSVLDENIDVELLAPKDV